MQVPSLDQEDPWNRKWQPTLVFLPRESHGQRGLAGYSPQRHKAPDTTERLSIHTLKSQVKRLSRQRGRGVLELRGEV